MFIKKIIIIIKKCLVKKKNISSDVSIFLPWIGKGISLLFPLRSTGFNDETDLLAGQILEEMDLPRFFLFLSHEWPIFKVPFFLIFKIKTGASGSSVRQLALDFSTGYDPVFWDRAPWWAPHSVGSLPEDSLSHFAPPYH